MRSFILLAGILFSLNNFAQKKLALIVSVGNYPAESNIPPIASLNDIKFIREVLNTNGFDNADIDTLKDEKATKAGILKALEAIAHKSKNGDIVLVHFSAHGQQIRDQSTLELGKDEEDGLDEALLPYDVKRTQYFAGVYEGENHLRDDDLAPKLMNIRNKLGKTGNLLVLIDACHSGTATRSQEFLVSRGEPLPFLDPENPLPEFINLPESSSFFKLPGDSASNMVVISGSGPHQQNFQIEVMVNGKKEQVGSLTYGFYKAMKGLAPGNNYELLFQKIKAFIQAHHPLQIPMIEGDINQEIFGGKFIPATETIYATPVLNDIRSTNDSNFKINKGLMEGMVEGTQIKLLDPENNKITGTGIIKKSLHFSAYGIANILLEKGVLYKAEAEALNFGISSFVLKIKADKRQPTSLALQNQFINSLKSYKNISIGDLGDMMLDIQESPSGTNLQLIDKTNQTRWQKNNVSGESLSPADQKELIAVIRNSMRLEYLRSMPDGGELAKMIKVDIIPDINQVVNNSEMILLPGNLYSLKIENNSPFKLFYTILNLTTDNGISIMYPSEIKEPTDYFIDKKGKVNRRLKVSSGTTAGREYLKIIVSKEPMDLRGVFNQTLRRSEMNSFQEVLDDLFSENKTSTLRGEVGNLKVQESGIITVSFLIQNNK